jgi:ERF superfamily
MTALAEALVSLQAELPEVRKGETAKVQTKQGGSYTYSYANLADCSRAVLPLLAKNGLSFSAKPTMVENQFTLVYTLRHTSGAADTGEYPLPDPTRSTPQEIGSAITYARRYALCAVTGLTPDGDDDDAQAASAKPATDTHRRGKPKALPVPDIREPLWADIKHAREAKGWTAEDVASDFAATHEGRKLMAATADELLAYLEKLKTGDPS